MKIIIGFIIGLLIALAVNVFAYRTTSPPKLKIDDPSSIIQLNDWLEDIWELTKGRYSVNVITTAPTGTASEGDMKAYYSGVTRRLYIYINGAWRYINCDG